jgi:hypothetical protein
MMSTFLILTRIVKNVDRVAYVNVFFEAQSDMTIYGKVKRMATVKKHHLRQLGRCRPRHHQVGTNNLFSRSRYRSARTIG